MLAVIGLDGASPHIIAENLSKLPTFKRLLNDFNSTVLYCDVTLHSAPIWITVFTGVSDKVHGIKSFHNGERLYTRQDLKFPLLWETLAEKGYKAIAFNVPCFMPPICFGCRYEMHLPAILSLSEKEILGSNRYYLRRSLRLIRKNPDFFATVFPSLDRAQHLFWGNQRKILYYYKEIDKTLAKLTPHLDKFVIMSDHGFTDFENSPVRHRWIGRVGVQNRRGDHHPEGILITNLSNAPKRTTEIYRFLFKQFQ